MLTTQFFTAFVSPFAFAPGLRGAATGPRVTLLDRIRRHLRARRHYEELLELPDYLLEDVGLTRDQIGAELRKTFF